MLLGLVSAIVDTMNFEEMIDFVSEAGLECVEVACWPAGKAERRYAGVSHIDAEKVLEDDAYAQHILDYTTGKKVKLSSLAYYPNTMDEVEDSAMGFIKMKNGAAITLEAAWAINMLESREASTTLCGTLAGAEIHSGMSYSKNELIYNRGRNNQLMHETLSPVGGVAYFGGGGGEEGTIDCAQWLNAIKNGNQPLVKPEEALAVTQILDAIYLSAREGKEIKF